MGLLQRRNNGRMRSALSNAANSLPSVFQSHSDRLQLTKPGHSSASSQVLVPRPFLSGQYCDSSLEKLRISYWTKVPVSNKLAATLISFYIETDHKIMGFFDADVFLEDLVECRRRFCSAFLVNAVLCLACQEYTAIKPHTNLIRPAAFREAEMLWQGEGSDGSLVSLAAMGIFSAACIFEGKDKIGQEVATILRQEAERLGVCRSSASSSTTATLDLGSPELVRATSQIAWGAYNWLTYVISSRNQAYLNRTTIGSMSSSIIANPSDFLRLYQSPGILRIGICHTQVIHVIWAQRSLTHAIFGQLLKRFWVCTIIQTKHQFRNVYHWPLQKESIGSSWNGLAPLGVT
ncbi:C6 transcription factor [Fusarium oxysporum f. sp. phaseoli]